MAPWVQLKQVANGFMPLVVTSVEVEKISNFHLKKVVKNLCQLGREGKIFINYFQSNLNNTLDNIEPELTQSNLVSLLVKRPIAVVRGEVNLELQGLPAVNQNWQVFRQRGLNTLIHLGWVKPFGAYFF